MVYGMVLVLAVYNRLSAALACRCIYHFASFLLSTSTASPAQFRKNSRSNNTDRLRRNEKEMLQIVFAFSEEDAHQHTHTHTYHIIHIMHIMHIIAIHDGYQKGMYQIRDIWSWIKFWTKYLLAA